MFCVLDRQKAFFFGPSSNPFYNRLNEQDAAKAGGGGGDDDGGGKETAASKFTKEINSFFESLLGNGPTAVAPTFVRAIVSQCWCGGAVASLGAGRFVLSLLLLPLCDGRWKSPPPHAEPGELGVAGCRWVGGGVWNRTRGRRASVRRRRWANGTTCSGC